MILDNHFSLLQFLADHNSLCRLVSPELTYSVGQQDVFYCRQSAAGICCFVHVAAVIEGQVALDIAVRETCAQKNEYIFPLIIELENNSLTMVLNGKLTML